MHQLHARRRGTQGCTDFMPMVGEGLGVHQLHTHRQRYPRVHWLDIHRKECQGCIHGEEDSRVHQLHAHREGPPGGSELASCALAAGKGSSSEQLHNELSWKRRTTKSPRVKQTGPVKAPPPAPSGSSPTGSHGNGAGMFIGCRPWPGSLRLPCRPRNIQPGGVDHGCCEEVQLGPPSSP